MSAFPIPPSAVYLNTMSTASTTSRPIDRVSMPADSGQCVGLLGLQAVNVVAMYRRSQ